MTDREKIIQARAESTCARLELLTPQWLGDRFWWRQTDVLRALRVPTDTRVCALIPPEHRRRLSTGQWPTIRRIGLIDRFGVERLILRYGGTTPRSAQMLALDRSTHNI